MEALKKKLNKNAIFRVNFNAKIGMGHLIRCLRIIEKIKKNYSIFLAVDNIGNNKKILELTKEYKVINIYNPKKKFINQKKDCDLFLEKTKKINKDILFIDDYRLDIQWHKRIRRLTKKLIIIDDLSNRKMYCDYYINYKSLRDDYILNKAKKICNFDSKLLIGSKFVILDENLKKIQRKTNPFNIMINFGNSFNFLKIKKLLSNLSSEKFKKKINLIVCIGIFAKNYNYIFGLQKKYKNIKLIYKKIFIDQLINKVSFFIGSSGNSIYETAYLKIPGIFFEISDNQINNKDDLADLGHFFSFSQKNLNNKNCINLVHLLINNYERISRLNSYKKINLKKDGVKEIIKVIKI